MLRNTVFWTSLLRIVTADSIRPGEHSTEDRAVPFPRAQRGRPQGALERPGVVFERKARPSGRGRADTPAEKPQQLASPASSSKASQSRKLSIGRPGVPPVVAPCPNAPGVDAVGQGCTSDGGNPRRVPYGPTTASSGNQRLPRSRLSTPPASQVGGVRPMARPVSGASKGCARTHSFGRSPLLRSGDRACAEPQAGESETDWRRHAPIAPTWRSRTRYSRRGGSYRRGHVGPPDAPRWNPRALARGGCQTRRSERTTPIGKFGSRGRYPRRNQGTSRRGSNPGGGIRLRVQMPAVLRGRELSVFFRRY
jgi:hypothetical protein